jgi:tetratricopeptide (TPR) repeat protein
MTPKNIIIIVIIVVAVALGGYVMGTRKGSDSPAANGYGGNVGPKTSQSHSANRPVDYNEVLADLEARLMANPDDWTLNAQLGDTLFGMRRFAESIDYYEKALQINPDDANLYNNLALANHYIGDAIKGLQVIEEGIRRDPYYQRVYLTKGFLLAYGFGNGEEASLSWEKAVSLDPDSQIGKAAQDYLEEFKKKK